MYCLLGFLIIDLAVILAVPLSLFGIVGVLVAIGWVTFSFIAIVEQKKEQQLIDHFYLEMVKDNEQKRI